MIYVYKDIFLSGWGKAKEGSYVLSDLPLIRDEFELIHTANKLEDVHFSSGKDKHFCYWCKDGYDYELKWIDKCSPLKIAKQRQTWNIELNTGKVLIT